jgi:hypothetical protein
MELHFSRSGLNNAIRIHETWFEINYSTVSSNDFWNTSITGLTLIPGSYNYVLHVNNTSGTIVNATGNITVLPKLVVMNLSITDASQNFKQSSIQISGSNEIEFNSTINESTLVSVETGSKNIMVKTNRITECNYPK